MTWPGEDNGHIDQKEVRTVAGQQIGTPSAQQKFADLVFEGGGVRGIALAGALAVIEEHGYLPQNLAGTSAGAIVATLRAAGYQGEELRRIIAGEEYRRLIQTDWIDRIPLIGAPLGILLHLGIYQGDAFFEEMRRLLEAKDVHTFRDLVHPTYVNEPKYRYKVQIIASDVTKHRLLVLPRDADALGVVPDDLNVALAVRMSMSIPIFFEPVRFHNPQTGKEHIIVDGGMLSNFPVWVFDSPGVPEWPTFGIRLVQGDPKSEISGKPPVLAARGSGGATTVVEYVAGLVQTMIEAHDRLYMDQSTFVRTVTIPTGNIASTNFDLSPEQVTYLYESGRTAAEQFLADWDFPAYIAGFRSGTEPRRRQELAAELRSLREVPVAFGPL